MKKFSNPMSTGAIVALAITGTLVATTALVLGAGAYVLRRDPSRRLGSSGVAGPYGWFIEKVDGGVGDDGTPIVSYYWVVYTSGNVGIQEGEDHSLAEAKRSVYTVLYGLGVVGQKDEAA